MDVVPVHSPASTWGVSRAPLLLGVASPQLAETTATRIMLARARHPGAAPGDVVTFVATCPGCGVLREWTEERDDTRVLVRIECTCTAA